MDFGFAVDSSELNRAVSSAEVISILFPLVGKSLVIDTRTDDRTEPMVCVLPRAGSLEERARGIRRLRPSLPKPTDLAAFPWPKYVGSLLETRMYAIILSRLEASGSAHALQSLAKAVGQLHRLERLELAAVLQGEGYHTIWSNRA